MLRLKLQNATRSKWGSSWRTNQQTLSLRLIRSERSIIGRLFRVGWMPLIRTCINKEGKMLKSVRRFRSLRHPMAKLLPATIPFRSLR